MANKSTTTNKSTENEIKVRKWFVARTYGYGWYPITWQGWAIVFLVVIDIVFSSLAITLSYYPTLISVLFLSLQEIVVIILLIIICNLTGPKPKWRWGRDK